MVIKETNEFLLEYDEGAQTLKHRIKKFNIHESWVDLLTTGTDYLEKHKVTKWISDNRTLSVTPEETSKWINEVWLPRTIKAGWKKWALVEPEKNIGKMHLQQFIKNFSEMGIAVNVFTTPEAARKWVMD